MKKRMILLTAGLMAVSLSACGSSTEAEGTISVESVSEITGGNQGLANTFAGMVVAEKEVQVQKNDNMEVDKVKVKEGQDVKKGDVLFTYDTESLSLELEKEQLELEQLKSTIETKTTEKATLEKEKAKATSSEQLEYTIQIQEVETDIKEAEYNQKQKEKEIRKTEKTLKHSKVKSPISGRIKKVASTDDSSDTEDYYDDYGSDSSDNAFITIIKSGSYQVKGTVNEVNANALTEGMPLTIRSRTDSSQTWSGSLDSIDWENTTQSTSYYYSSDEMTSTTKYPFYVTLDEQDGLILGQHVYIETGLDTEETTLDLPSYYIVDAEGDAYVWAEDDGKLKKTSVTLGQYDEENDTYVIIDGLTLEDYIAFPDETCEAGMTTEHYDPEAMEEEMTGEEGMTDEEMIGEESMITEE